MMRAARQGTAILLAAAAFTAGCTAPAPSQTAHRGAGDSTRAALASAEQRVHCAEIRHQPGTRLPAGLAAEAAILCETAITLVQGNQHVAFTERVADHGLAPLLAALRRPSVPSTPGVSCLAGPVTLQVFLIDTDGQIIRPAIPVDGCELPLQQFLAALRHVPWVILFAGTDRSCLCVLTARAGPER
jgi:hypothetical protein